MHLARIILDFSPPVNVWDLILSRALHALVFESPTLIRHPAAKFNRNTSMLLVPASGEKTITFRMRLLEIASERIKKTYQYRVIWPMQKSCYKYENSQCNDCIQSKITSPKNEGAVYFRQQANGAFHAITKRILTRSQI